jgi:hypothetical protein
MGRGGPLGGMVTSTQSCRELVDFCHLRFGDLSAGYDGVRFVLLLPTDGRVSS